MALSDDRMDELSREMVKGNKSVNWLASKIEAEVREEYTELIQQLVEALEGSIAITMVKIDQRNAALIAGRARLEGKP